MGARARECRADYDGAGAAHRTADRKARADRARTFPDPVFNRGLTLFGFSPCLSVHHERRATNA